MKRLILSVTVASLALGSAMADRPVAEQKTQKDNADYEYVVLTGSHIKQRVKKRNIIAIGNNGPVLVIDQKEMARNGNGQIADQLSRYPGVQISGGH
jgi:outer membrane receptor for Fe3+-dicitrate